MAELGTFAEMLFAQKDEFGEGCWELMIVGHLK